jgi:TonB family protein
MKDRSNSPLIGSYAWLVAAATILLTLLFPAAGSAQESSSEAQKPTLTKRPKLVKSVQPRYPPEAWEQDLEGDVVLLLWVTEQGRVEATEVVSAPGYGMELAALAAAKQLEFSPAEADGKPVKVKIRYTFRFRKPEKGTQALPPDPFGQKCKEDRRSKGSIKGILLQRGTGKPLGRAEVYLLDLDQAVLTDDQGKFEKEVSPGGYAITVNFPGHFPFEALERVDPGETVEVTYYVEQKRHERYKTIVWGSEGKAVVGRTTLADAEIYEVPGTMGDPIRVVMLMPGVTSSVTGVGYPVVRGVLPGDTRYEVDGVQVPMLYHLMIGNAVINPRFTTGIAFHPGGYSVRYGQFPGALILSGATPRPTERVTAVDISLIHASLFHAQPITKELDVVVAGRYGTLGLIIEALASDVIFRYWDYQAKIGYNLTGKDRIELLVFGAGNEVGEEREGREDVFHMGFHRLKLQWKRTLSSGWFVLWAELGQDGFEPPNESEEPDPDPDNERERPPVAGYSYAALRARASITPRSDLELHAGAEVDFQDFDFSPPVGYGEFAHAEDGVTSGAYLEAEWTPGGLTVVPGVRVDHYRYGIDEGHSETSVDLRLAVAFDITEEFTLKTSAGSYHGPPRVTLVSGPFVMGPVPGMLGAGLNYGLSRSIQLAAGVEVKFPWRLELAVQGYYNFLHTALDFSLMNTSLESDCDQVCVFEPGPADDESLPTTDGRSYGVELMLRRKLGESFFGWITYSLTRSERNIEGVGTLPFAFDQTHVLNTVVSWEVGRHWTLGATFHYHSGRPYTPELVCPGSLELGTCRGDPFSRRLPGFWRLDLRIQKRELFDTWYFDFYIDVMNVTFNKEVIDYEIDWDGTRKPVKFPILVPMLGLRGQF